MLRDQGKSSKQREVQDKGQSRKREPTVNILCCPQHKGLNRFQVEETKL